MKGNDYEKERINLKEKIINIIDNEPSNHQEIIRFLNRLTYLRGIKQGIKLSELRPKYEKSNENEESLCKTVAQKGCGKWSEEDKDGHVYECGLKDYLCDKCKNQNKEELRHSKGTVKAQYENEHAHYTNCPLDNKGVENCSCKSEYGYECDECKKDLKNEEVNIRQIIQDKKGCSRPFQKIFKNNSKYPEDYIICGYTKIGDDVQFCLECQQDLLSAPSEKEFLNGTDNKEKLKDVDNMGHPELEDKIEEHMDDVQSKCRKAQLNEGKKK